MSNIPTLPPKYLPRTKSYDHQKRDREFEVMREQDELASNVGQTVVDGI